MIRSVCIALTLSMLGGVSMSAGVADEPPSRPNILLVLVDDLGFSDLGCYGSEIQTPRLDALAANGLRFREFYNTGRCWPTRASLLSGFYAQQVRRDILHDLPLGGGGKSDRPAWAKLLPEMLSSAGYRSFHSGKWHIDGTPEAAGFDRSYSNQGRYFYPPESKGPKAKKSVKKPKTLGLEDATKPIDFYLTTEMADRAIGFLQEHQRDYGDQPFFQYLAFTAPHFPLHAKPEDIDIYRGRYDAGWDVCRAQRWARMRELGVLDEMSVDAPSRPERDLGPPYHFPDAFEILGDGETNRPLPWNRLTDEQKKFQAAKMEIHAAMIHRVDIELGRVLDQIESMGKTEDTLVMFLSDNGASAEIMVRGDGHDPSASMGSALTYLCLGPGWSTVCNTPFRRHKTWTHEGGISTPMIVSWPGKIDDVGTIVSGPRHVIEVVPTLLEITGAKRPDEKPALPGRGFADELLSKTRNSSGKEDRAYWWLHDGHRALRMGSHKAVKPINEPWELYDLSVDRGEQNDLAIQKPEMLATWINQWNQISSEINQMATADISEERLEKAAKQKSKPNRMNLAQEAARPKRRQVLLGGESLFVAGRHAFVMTPDQPSAGQDRPWVFYAPSLPGTPDSHESYLHQRLLDAGIAIAGIDVGEAYGSPYAFPFFEALYAEMKSRGFNDRPVLLGRSRGGLWVSSWAIANPDRVKAIAGIYPVFDVTSYPKPPRAAPAYGLSLDEMESQLETLNPIASAERIAKNRIPVFIIHGEDDQVVPMESNSAALLRVYQSQQAQDVFTLQRVPGQGHNYWSGFFRCDPLIDFMIEQSK